MHLGLRTKRRLRSRRGATLIVTVLLGLVVASITLVIVRTALDDARVTASRRAYDLAYGSAREVATELSRQLAADQSKLLRNVSDNEPDRICDALQVNGAATVVSAGQPWPAACGTSWSYAPTSGRTTLWVNLPSPSEKYLKIRAVSEVAGSRAGVELQMRPGSSNPAIYAESAMNLGDLSGGSGTSELRGLIYATGSVTIPSSGATFENAVIATESSLNGSNATGVRSFAGSGISNTILPIRDILQKPAVAGSLRSRVGSLTRLACPGGGHVSAASGSNQLCLKSGATLKDSLSQTVQVPSEVTAWLVLPEKSSTGTLDILYRTSISDLADQCPSATPACSLSDLAAATVGHPSRIGSWTTLGTFALPTSGVVGTDTETHIGLCGENFANSGGACSAYRTNTAGVNMTKNMTFVVGTPQSPADLYISGPVNSPDVDLGLVVSGDIVIPYWSRPTAENFSIDANFVVLGRSVDAVIRTLPSQDPGSQNRGGTLTLAGSIAMTRASFELELFSNHRVLTYFKSSSAPWLSASNGWSLDRVRRLTAAELAAPSTF